MKLVGKTQADLAADAREARKAEIAGRLKALDAEINYVQEDIIKSVGLKLHPSKQAILDEKAALRAELKAL